MRDCGVCRARRSRGGLFPLAYSPSKAIGRNSQRSGIPTEILKISVFWPVLRTRIRLCKCHPIGSAEKSPSRERGREGERERGKEGERKRGREEERKRGREEGGGSAGAARGRLCPPLEPPLLRADSTSGRRHARAQNFGAPWGNTRDWANRDGVTCW